MDERPFETINVIPFVDIMLVLLAMVLTTANFIATGRIPVALPQASHADVEKQKNTIIELAADGQIYFEGQPASKEELEARLASLPADASFLIRADRGIAFQRFIDVADILKGLKFTKVAVQVEGAAK
ncbi:ExbD/TolR family protein [Methylocapsa acidiphila]|uniref:ExbD/TolR family protein n=1 Tax=Methylocapsa acidiphila TaxID=133552 RepID=UPI00040905BC|nr:biopolymer transporter ExbD [Methylocapsa acidiphila]